MKVESMSLFLREKYNESFTLSEISNDLGCTKDAIRHQARKALAMGHVEIVGTTTRSSATPANLFKATEAFLSNAMADQEISVKGKDNQEDVDDLYIRASVNFEVMKSVCLVLSGVSPVPETLKASMAKKRSLLLQSRL